MALKSTIYKVELNITDMDRNYYQDHTLTVAQHPSETPERLMIRILTFALHASEHLTFTKGLSADNEPDLWEKDLTGEIKQWIDLGQPDEKRLRKACGRADKVFIYTYQERSAKIWWEQIEKACQRFKNLTVIHLNVINGNEELSKHLSRNMALQVTIQDNQVWITDTESTTQIDLKM